MQQLAELNDSSTASLIWDALPIEAQANTWGDEIYFCIPVEAGYDNARDVVDMGDLAYWSPGNAFCIFFGLTPASRGNEIRPASAVNVFGRLQGDPTDFKQTLDGESVVIQRVES